MRRELPLRVSLCVFLCAFAAPAFADYEQAFREGVRAFERKRWVEATEFMKVAIRLQPVADGHAINIKGGFSVPYAPYHYLAAAYADLGECADAHATMEKARGVARNEPLRKLIDEKCPQAKQKKKH